MKKLLLQLDSDRFPSVFDAVAAYDAGVDTILPYGGVTPVDVRNLVYGVMFTRGPKDLKNSAIYVGGSEVAAGEQLLKAVTGTFFGPFRTSVMLDSNGSNTTAAAAVVKLGRAIPLAGTTALVLAGSGPVGQRVSVLLAGEGCQVRLASRSLDRARAAAEQIKHRFDREVVPVQVSSEAELRKALDGVAVVVATGAPGVQLLPRAIWTACPDLKAMADLNAVAPAGIEGVEPADDGVDRDGKLAFGPIAIGNLKMKAFRACIARLFERNDLVLDVELIAEITRGVA